MGFPRNSNLESRIVAISIAIVIGQSIEKLLALSSDMRFHRLMLEEES